ncbi:MAG TPA: sialidase family protein [Microthrixaceae bacterium]|nr:sialidase family protein [Microthrixaceae bacterium]
MFGQREQAKGRVDDGDVDLVSKRSTDDGRAWGDLQVVADMGSNFIGNPSPVLYEESARLVVAVGCS